MHIPKTGGTSIEHMLGHWLGRDQIAAHVELLSEAERDALGDKKFVSGHLGYAAARRLSYWSEFKRAVVLREPYARLASNIRMTARFGMAGNEAQLATLPESVRPAAVKLSRIDIEDPQHLAWFLRHEAAWATDAFADCQTNYLGGAPDALDNAIKNLADFHYIGITERLYTLVCEVAPLFSQPAPRTVSHSNSATSSGWVHAPTCDHTGAALREVMRPFLMHDLKLYKYVVKKVQKG